MRTTVKISPNKLSYKIIARELRLLRSFMIGLAGRDPEGNLIEIQETVDEKCDFPLDQLAPITKKQK